MLQNTIRSTITPTGLSTPINVALPDAIECIVKELDPEKIVLFGSYANGTPTPDSDVDLLIIMETNAISKERSWAVSRLLIPRQFPVDIIVKTPAEIEFSLERGDTFIRNVPENGQLIYERDE